MTENKTAAAKKNNKKPEGSKEKNRKWWWEKPNWALYTMCSTSNSAGLHCKDSKKGMR